MTVVIYNVLIAFCWVVLTSTIVGATVAIAFNDMLATIFFMVNTLCMGYVLCRLRGE
jgi:hypothetical protein